MLTVQACQQHRLVVMHPNNAKSFPAATVPAAAKLGHRRGKRGTRSKESRIARRPHVSRQKSRLRRSRGVVGVLHPPRRKSQGGNLGRNVELSERRRALARKKRRRKQAMRKAARMKHTPPGQRGGHKNSRLARSTCVQQHLKASTVSVTSTSS